MMQPRSLTNLVASVERLDPVASPAFGVQASPVDSWQDEAWQMYDTVGELSSVCGWLSNSASRVTLFAAEVSPETGRADRPTTDPDAQDIVAGMAGGWVGQSDMLRQAAVLLTVVGEYYVVILVDDDTGRDVWRIIPADRVNQLPTGGYEVIIDGGTPRVVNPDTESIFRVWRGHPRRPEMADSSVRSALPVLREIRAMDQVIDAAAKSRVSGAGLLIIPKEAGIPTGVPPTAQPVGRAGGESGFRQPAASFGQRLAQTMRAAIDDPSSPEAITPIVVTVPGEHADRFRHLTLETEIAEKAVETREKAIRRLALSLDIPPEVLTGLGDSTHWNANLVDESALKQHIAPMMSTICEAMTTAVLHPMLIRHDDTGLDDDHNNRIVVGFDMSAIAQKTDKSGFALDAFDKGLIDAEATRRELGFAEDDTPEGLGEAERLKQMAERMVVRAPSLFPYLAEVLGFEPPAGGFPPLGRGMGDFDGV